MPDPWNQTEVDLVVDAYFSMLGLELAGESYSKTHFRRSLMGEVDRTESSLEFKFQNVSAVLDELGAVWINGYKPARNVQQLLRERVAVRYEQAVDLRREMFHAVEAPATEVASLAEPEIAPSTRPPNSDLDRLARRLDFPAIEATNRSLGLAGELAVLDFERRRLQAAGYSGLAARVRHASVEEGDGLGYDIESFDELTQASVFIEVKTTRYSKELPFFVSRNEVDFSQDAGDSYRLARVYGFGKKSGHYWLRGPLRDSIWLDPHTYLGGPAQRA